MTYFIPDGAELTRTHIQGPPIFADGDQRRLSANILSDANWVKVKHADGTLDEVRLNHILDYQRFAAQPA